MKSGVGMRVQARTCILCCSAVQGLVVMAAGVVSVTSAIGPWIVLSVRGIEGIDRWGSLEAATVVSPLMVS